MCTHCDNLEEDKEIVHAFMKLAAQRLSEKHGVSVSPNDVEVEISLTIGPRLPNWATMIPTMKALNEMHK
jgi:hypothetical protein